MSTSSKEQSRFEGQILPDREQFHSVLTCVAPCENMDRETICSPNRKCFFSRNNGQSIRPVAISLSFKMLRRQAGIARPRDAPRQPRVQDLRWTFAVHTLRQWHRKRKDLRSLLGVLGAYLGHVDLTSTEAYLAVTPQRFLAQLSSLS